MELTWGIGWLSDAPSLEESSSTSSKLASLYNEVLKPHEHSKQFLLLENKTCGVQPNQLGQSELSWMLIFTRRQLRFHHATQQLHGLAEQLR